MDGFQQPVPEQSSLELSERPPRRRLRLRHIVLTLAGLIAVAAVSLYGHHWWTTGRFLEETDDAYTQADAVTVAPRVGGTISEVLVTDNQLVQAGQVVAKIDDRDYRAALAQAQADAAAARADIGNLDAQITLQQAAIEQARTDIASAQAALDFARADYARYTDLMRTGNGTVQRAQQADADIRAKTAALARSRAALDAAQQQVQVLQAQRAKATANVARAEAAVQQAELNLSYTTIAAPVDGAVGDRSLRLGWYVQPGTKLLDVVPVGQAIYVVANFKETQLARMWRGEQASISVDMLPDVKLRGHVDSLAPGSGAQFALLPPENATGNFTKIVQRVPVKIVLEEADQATLAKLRPGLSVLATVDTRTRPEGPPQTLVGEAPARASPMASAQ
jgi:membrane fusion protein (multidrug efflux system)